MLPPITVKVKARRPPTRTSDSAPIDIHHTPASLQFRVLYTYVYTPIYYLYSVRMTRMYTRTLPVLPDEDPEERRPPATSDA